MIVYIVDYQPITGLGVYFAQGLGMRGFRYKDCADDTAIPVGSFARLELGLHGGKLYPVHVAFADGIAVNGNQIVRPSILSRLLKSLSKLWSKQ